MVFAGIPKLAVILTLLTADGQYNEGHREERKEHTKVTLVKPGVELWLRPLLTPAHGGQDARQGRRADIR